MRLYIHFGFPRTATTTSQIHLFPNHPQINYLGRYPNTTKRKLELIDLISNLNNDDFDKRYNELLKKTEELYLDPNKTNVLSSEFIVSNTMHYPNDFARTMPSFISRLESLFSKINVEIKYFCTIRNQAEIIPSLYSATRTISFNGKELVEYLENKKSNNPMIKRFLNGFNYYELYNELSKVVNKNKIKFFLYEEFRDNFDNFVSNLSNYLEIDPVTSIKLLKYRYENSVKESNIIESHLPALCFKLIKNFKSPKILFENFNKKLLNMFKLLNQQIRKFDKKDKEVIKIKKENLIKQLNVIKNNSPLIKKYYRNDCLELKNKLKLDIDKYDYF
jgi:hypothetical protein